MITHAATHRGTLNQVLSPLSFILQAPFQYYLAIMTDEPCEIQVILYSNHLPSSHRAFRINELKTEVTNRLAMLEKRVERKWDILPFVV